MLIRVCYFWGIIFDGSTDLILSETASKGWAVHIYFSVCLSKSFLNVLRTEVSFNLYLHQVVKELNMRVDARINDYF